MLAEEFVKMGHEVRVVTQTPASERDELSFEILRRPSAGALCRVVRWCDVFFHNNISLQTAWPLALIRRPWVIAHHTWIARPNGRLGWQDRLKLRLLRFASSIAVSRAVAESLPVASVVVPDPYNDELFREEPNARREKELIFVGRLVSDKGADILIDALGQLRPRDLTPRLTIIGEGPERETLRQLASEPGVEEQICFVGSKTGPELVELLNEHQILVVPSRWQEPFGIVALEGIACGCVVVGSSGGGLKEAIGACGVTVPNGNALALAGALEELLRQPKQLAAYRANADEHLRRHRRGVVASEYLKVMLTALARRTTRSPRAELAANLKGVGT